jgi:hypothetical protein
MSKKIFVCCPGNTVTGGPELLHQFVDKLRQQGADAQIMYYPFEDKFSTPSVYEHYDAPVADFSHSDFDDATVIFPEVCTRFARLFDKANIVVWWLSVDNYFGPYSKSNLTIKIRHFQRSIRGKKLFLRSMKKYHHMTQSEYARIFLAKSDLSSTMLTDYLNDAHLKSEPSAVARENIIAYNPKKGVEYTQALISSNPNIQFVPIENMTPQQVRELLLRSKVYIDFGTHPGKDRFPREAAMAGCCIITGKRGSAENNIDVPIPQKYKIDEKDSQLAQKFGVLVSSIFADFESHSLDFDNYRRIIRQEPEIFEAQTRSFVERFCH